jgi:hypothetical protein
MISAELALGVAAGSDAVEADLTRVENRLSLTRSDRSSSRPWHDLPEPTSSCHDSLASSFLHVRQVWVYTRFTRTVSQRSGARGLLNLTLPPSNRNETCPNVELECASALAFGTNFASASARP